MDFKTFSHFRAETRAEFDHIEDWLDEAFGDSRDNLFQILDERPADLAVVAAKRRKGMKYFAAGRCAGQRLFASWLFPFFEGDPLIEDYRAAIKDVLKVAGGSVQPRTRHKLSFDLGTLYFTGDNVGNIFGVVASECFPMDDAFKFLQEMLDIYDGIDVASALDTADPSIWDEPHFRDDAFGVKELATGAWRNLSRPHDGFCFEPSAEFMAAAGIRPAILRI
mmetsp:Transcript_24159/g.51523  ORF Transcript_24159/g.51523 Transcript_24159/m.51523 type:complete len:222 (+) Transcript_24159:128-793(+)